MNAVIDQGNSSYKLGVYDQDVPVYVSQGTDILSMLMQIKELYPDLSNGIISSVGNFPHRAVFELDERISWVFFSCETAVPLKNRYLSPQTLGLDRLAAAAGAVYIYPQQDVLVIDAGTAVTYEYVSASGEYLGGNISPGLSMRFQALHTFTAKLPLLTPGAPSLHYGQDTPSAIRLGVESGMAYEIDGAIEHFTSLFPQGIAVITGGDAGFFEKKLKSRIFAQPDLVLIGLNNILNYHIENNLS